MGEIGGVIFVMWMKEKGREGVYIGPMEGMKERKRVKDTRGRRERDGIEKERRDLWK